MKRPLLCFALFAVFFSTASATHGFSAPTRRLSQASYDVRITPTSLPAGETSVDIGPQLWSARGYDLRNLIARVFTISPARIDLASAVSNERYDVSVALSGDESDDAIQHILINALAARFHLSATLERRSVDVYVLTAPKGPGPELHLASTTSQANSGASRLDVALDSEDDTVPEVITVEGRDCLGFSLAGITAQGSSLKGFAHALESELDRPILDETHLAGIFNFRVSAYTSAEQLLSRLHDELGLTVTAARRDVEILAIRSIGASEAVPTETAALMPVSD